MGPLFRDDLAVVRSGRKLRGWITSEAPQLCGRRRLGLRAPAPLDFGTTPRAATSGRTPPGPEGSKGRQALSGAWGAFVCCEAADLSVGTVPVGVVLVVGTGPCGLTFVGRAG